MGNWISSPPKRGGDIFSDVRQIQKDIQRSKSQSDIAISLKLQQAAAAAKSPKSKFLQSRFGSKSREPSGDRRVRSSASVSSVPAALANAQERARKRDKSSQDNGNLIKSRDDWCASGFAKTLTFQKSPLRLANKFGPETVHFHCNNRHIPQS